MSKSLNLRRDLIIYYLIKMFFFHLLSNWSFDGVSGDHIALLINNMGSTSDLEINIVAREAILLLGLCNHWSYYYYNFYTLRSKLPRKIILLLCRNYCYFEIFIHLEVILIPSLFI